MIRSNILEAIGDTPLIRLKGLVEGSGAELYGKAEFLNPMGSVKDRPALSMIDAAEREGRIRPGMIIVEPTSGNTGVGLAMVAAVRGYGCLLIHQDGDVADAICRIARALGAKTVSTPDFKSAVAFAESLARSAPDRYFIPQQFCNYWNPEAHVQGTAQEILRDLGSRLKAFVAAYGSGGTFTGVSRTLKAFNPDIHFILVEPDTAQHFGGGGHCCSEIHGIGPSFVPTILEQNIHDEVFVVSEDEANRSVLLLAQQNGLLCGPSAGAMVHAAARIAQRYGPEDAVVTILPDRGERYFGEDFFPE